MSLRLVAVSDLQGNWDAIAAIAKQRKVDAVVHTGNFGFWNAGTIERATDVNYLKQIVAFLEVLPRQTVRDLNDLLTISNQNGQNLWEFRDKLQEVGPLSHLDEYIGAVKTFPCAVYTIVGPLDDPVIVEQFLDGKIAVPNLHIIDHNHAFTLALGTHKLRLYGLGGNLKVHLLFDHGAVDRMAGKVGDLWISMAQIAELYLNVRESTDTINVFVSHSPVVKTPLLEHLAIVTGADFTISQGLHFRYPVSGNGMSFVDSMGGLAGYIENYRSKFLRLRMILGELWLIIKNDVARMLHADAELRQLIELGLSLFDKIPVAISDPAEKIVRLTLDENDENETEADVSKQSLKRINDMYFSAYYNLWHFNLCDHVIRQDDDDDDDEEEEFNFMAFRLTAKGDLRLEHCNSRGFSFRKEREKEAKEHDDDDEYDYFKRDSNSGSDDDGKKTKEILNSTYKDYRARGRGRGRARGRGTRSRGRAR